MTEANDWVHIRSPFVYWSQTESTVSLRVDIRNAQVSSQFRVILQKISKNFGNGFELENVFVILQNPKINIEDSKVTFDSAGRGALGESVYHFDLDLPHSVNPKVFSSDLGDLHWFSHAVDYSEDYFLLQASTYRVLDRDIDILLKKEEKGWWSKITTSHRKPAWLKVNHSPTFI